MASGAICGPLSETAAALQWTSFGNVAEIKASKASALSSACLPKASTALNGTRLRYDRCTEHGRLNSRTYILSAISNRPSGHSSSSSGHSDDGTGARIDPARAALERLFRQAQRHEERQHDPEFSDELELETQVTELEGDLNAALSALREKEDELVSAEEALRADQDSLAQAVAALAERERAFQASRRSHEAMLEDLQQGRVDLNGQLELLERARENLTERENLVTAAQAALSTREAEVGSAHGLVLVKDEVVERAARQLRLKEGELAAANALLNRQSQQAQLLEASLKTVLVELHGATEELQGKEEKLKATEADLESRVMAWLQAQDELKDLRADLEESQSAGIAARRELDKASLLLADVQRELQASQQAISTFRDDVAQERARVSQKDEEVAALLAAQTARERHLVQVRQEEAKLRHEVGAAQAELEVVSAELVEQEKVAARLQEELARERARVVGLLGELQSLRAELRQRDAALSDGELSLQLAAAELVTARLDLQAVRSDYWHTQLLLAEKGLEVEAANQHVAALQREVMEVRALLAASEAKLTRATALLKEKDGLISSLQSDLATRALRLNEAETALGQIAAFSGALAASAAAAEEMSVADRKPGEKSTLMQTNYKLFSANRSLLEREMELNHLQAREATGIRDRQEIEKVLQALRESLHEKELELLQVQSSLGRKDGEINSLLERYDAREGQLAALREEVKEEAQGLALRHSGDSFGVQATSPSDAVLAEEQALKELELEVAKLELENALCALRGMVDLSRELLLDTPGSAVLIKTVNQMVELALGEPLQIPLATNRASDPQLAANVETAEEQLVAPSSTSARGSLRGLRSQLEEKDAALEMAKTAVNSLTQLTQRLAMEADSTFLSGYDDTGFSGAAA